MHFAVGMGCTGAAVGTACFFAKQGWRWLPAAMTCGGIWGLIPDLPRIWREDFTWLPFAETFGNKSLEASLHSSGNWFFFHRALDAQPHEYALHGLALVLLFYNLAIVLLMAMENRQRNSMANKAWRAHGMVINEENEFTREPQINLTFVGEDEDVIYPIDPNDPKQTNKPTGS